MSLSLGIYDVFSYIIPGSIYLFVFLHLTHWARNFITSPIQLWHGILLVALSYLLGILLDPIAVFMWYRFFTSKNLHLNELENIKKNNPNLEITFSEKQWAVLMSHSMLHYQNDSHIDRYATLKIMLRNVSFGLVILSGVYLILFFINHYSLINISICIASLLLSIIAGREAQKFDHWMIAKTFENFVAAAIDPKDFVKPQPISTEKSRQEKSRK